MTDLSKPVTWTDGERHCVGRVAIVKFDEGLTGHCYDYRKQKIMDLECDVQYILIRHDHTGELEFVAVAKLREYIGGRGTE